MLAYLALMNMTDVVYSIMVPAVAFFFVGKLCGKSSSQMNNMWFWLGIHGAGFL